MYFADGLVAGTGDIQIRAVGRDAAGISEQRSAARAVGRTRSSAGPCDQAQ